MLKRTKTISPFHSKQFPRKISFYLTESNNSRQAPMCKLINYTPSDSNNQTLAVVYSTTTSVYSTLSFKNVNKNLLINDVITLDTTNQSLRYYTGFLNTVYYPLVNKFKLIGRHFKLKKKNKNFLVCSLNQSHKAYFLIKARFITLKLKPKKNKLLTVSFLNFYSSRLVADQLNKFRDLNKYTHKGIKSINQYKFKRKGKSTAI